MRFVVFAASAAIGVCGYPVFAQDEQGERTLLPADERAPVALPFPLSALRADAQAACNMTFDISAAGDSENICGVCAVDAPRANADKLEDLQADFVASATQFVRRSRRYEAADAPTLDQHVNLEFARDDLRRPVPELPAPITCTD